MEAFADPFAAVRIVGGDSCPLGRREQKRQPCFPEAGDQQKRDDRGQKSHDEGCQEIMDVETSRHYRTQTCHETADACRDHPQEGMLGKEGKRRVCRGRHRLVPRRVSVSV